MLRDSRKNYSFYNAAVGVCLFDYVRSQNYGKRLLTSSCLSVRPSVWNDSTPTGKIFHDVWHLGIFLKT